MNLTIDTSGAKRAIESLYDAICAQDGKADAVALVRDETIRLSRSIVRAIPPWDPSKSIGNKSVIPPEDAALEQIGNAAISKELYNLIGEAHPDTISRVSKLHGIKAVDGWLTTSTDAKLHLHWGNILTDDHELGSLHKSYRNREGKVVEVKSVSGEWNSRIMVPQGMRDPYVAKVQKHVGRWKASWAFVAYRLGYITWPAYIVRHFQMLGNWSVSGIEGLKDTVKPSVIFGSRIAGNFRPTVRTRIKQVVELRMRAIRNRVKYMTGQYKKDVETGHPVKRHAAESKDVV